MWWSLQKFVAGLLYDLDDPMRINWGIVEGVIAATPLLCMAWVVFLFRIWWWVTYGV